MRPWVEAVDPCSYLVVAACMHCAFTAVARIAVAYAKGTGWLALLALVLTFGIGFAELRPDTALTMLSLALVSWLGASFAGLAGMVILPVIFALWDGWRTAIARHREEVRRYRARMEAERVVARPLPPPPPQPPSTAESLAEAEKTYLEELRLIDLLLLPEGEKDQVKARAERKYLDRVAGLMGMS